MKKVCVFCGKTYTPTRWGQKYCSLVCLWEKNKKPIQKKKCNNCGEEFELSRRNSQKVNDGRLYCSKSCAYYGSERNKKISKSRVGRFCGENHSQWKGGKTICNGYERITKTKERTHRKLAEEKLGRKLREDEVVHHINGDKLDNRIENLQVMTNIEHCRLHKRNIEIQRDSKGRIISCRYRK